jgi:hypothetical protein
MTAQGIIVIDILGLALIILILNLIRTGKLHIAYGALWSVSTAALLLTVSVPPLLSLVTRLVGAVFPVSALTLLAFVFIFLVLIFFSVKLSALTTRQVELIQSLGLRELMDEAQTEDVRDESGPRSQGDESDASTSPEHPA